MEEKNISSNSGFIRLFCSFPSSLHFPRFTPHLIKLVILQVNSETTKVSAASLGGTQSAELLSKNVFVA